MKKIVMLCVVCSILLSLCACGQGTGGQGTGSQSSSAEQLTWQEQYDLGLRYLEEGNYEEAIIAFTVAIEIDPKRVETYNQLARVYLAMDDPDGAAAVLEQGVTATGDEDLRTWLEALRETELPLSGPRTERRDSGDGYYDLIYYDEAGRQTRLESYYQDGTLRCIFYYDETGRQTRLESYYQDGTLSYISYYDEAGRQTRAEGYDTDGTLNAITYYDETERQTRTEYYDPDGALVGYIIPFFDETGNRARVESYDGDGRVYQITYFDETGNQMRHEVYQNGVLRETIED